MRFDLHRIAFYAAASALAAGCTPGSDSTVSSVRNWGEANRQTLAAQVIDPTPQYDTAVPVSSGNHAAQAIERYRTDKVKKPERISTSDAGTQSGN